MSLAFKIGQQHYQLYNHVCVYVPVCCTGVWISKKNLLEYNIRMCAHTVVVMLCACEQDEI